MNLWGWLKSATLAAVLMILCALSMPVVATAQSLVPSQSANTGNDFSVNVPQGWDKYEISHTSFRGGKVTETYVTQTTDLVSRTTKYFLMDIGTAPAIFGLRDSVVRRLSHEQLVDFLIDQMNDSLIDYKVTKTYTSGEGVEKLYVIEANSAVPGFRQLTKTYIRFKQDRVFFWQVVYLDAFASYASTLQSIADSVTIN